MKNDQPTSSDEYDSEYFDSDDDFRKFHSVSFGHVSLNLHHVASFFNFSVYDTAERKMTYENLGKQTYMNSQCKSNKVTNYQPAEKLLKRFTNKINVEKYEGPSLPTRVANSLIESNKRFEAERYFTKFLRCQLKSQSSY